MKNAEWSQLRDHFDALRALPTVQREWRLRALEQSDPELAIDLRRLLLNDRDAGFRPIDLSIPERLATLLATAEAPDTAPPDLTGRILKDRYHVDSLLDRGGSSDVWLALDLHLGGRKVVIKTPHSALSGEGFQREVDALAGIHHPSIARPLDFGTTGEGSLFLVLEWVEGVSLRELLRRDGPMERGAALEVIRELAQALDEVHRDGVLHLDVKPENVMIRQAGGTRRAVLVDFGIARLQTDEDEPGGLRGSPAYMAPERFEGLDSPAADIYSLGLLALELLEAPSDPEPDPRRRLARMRPKALRHALARAIETDPARRPLTAGDLSDSLLHACRPLRRWLVPALIAAVLLAALTTVLGFRHWRASNQQLQLLKSTLAGAELDQLIINMDIVGHDGLTRQILHLGEFVETDSSDPKKVRRAAEALLETGMQYGHPGRRHLGMSAHAERILRRAVEMADRAATLAPSDDLARLLSARARDALAGVLIEEGFYPAAAGVLNESLRITEGRVEARGVRAGVLADLSRIAFHNHDYAECLNLRNRLVEERRCLWAADHSRIGLWIDYSGALAARGYLLREMSRYPQALADYAESDRLLLEAQRLAPQNQFLAWQHARNAMEEGRTLLRAGEPARAVSYLARATTGLRHFAAQDPTDQASARQLALSLASYAEAEQRVGRSPAQWAPHLDEALRLALEAAHNDPASAKANEDLAAVHQIAGRLRETSRRAGTRIR